MMKHVKQMTAFMMLTFILSCGKAPQEKPIALQEGDLIFTVGKGNSGLLKAIKNATSNRQEIPFSHVGIVGFDRSTFVIEAEPNKGVVKTSVDEFIDNALMLKGKPLVAVARLKPEYRYAIPGAIENAMKQIGKPYDFAYDEANDAFYCSELVRFSFLDTLGNPIFEPLAMSFKNKETGKDNPFWIEHFKKLNQEVPEGKLGTNPADMAKSDVIEIIFRSGY